MRRIRILVAFASFVAECVTTKLPSQDLTETLLVRPSYIGNKTFEKWVRSLHITLSHHYGAEKESANSDKVNHLMAVEAASAVTVRVFLLLFYLSR